ncbi:hypothetical protein BB558_000652 [Smittium angustum]|uniref:Uncharacterized protein n=1 Tax=Smittium angustum TaxID=133377 RepID=A0A2U1JDY8_SMIAN|nr:hypothetical protein BB558_000652 [Smittium angustum]
MSSNPLKELPHKGQTQFKAALKLFEIRDYKKGLKAADQILKKTPNHGESMALKGLFLFNLGKKEEGYTWVKDGLKQNFLSPISWHIYGLVYRADRKYEDAIRCYQQALKRDPDNMQILRDLSLLQTQTRNYSDLVQTRELLLKESRPAIIFWLGLAVAYHLNKQYQQAIDTIDKHFDPSSLDSNSPISQSEILSYKASLLSLNGNHQLALEFLESNSAKILDTMSLEYQKANLYLNLDNKKEAMLCFSKLLSTNSDSIDYIVGYLQSVSSNFDPTYIKAITSKSHQQTKPLQEHDSDEILSTLIDLKKQYPESNVLQILPLSFATGSQFETLSSEYLEKQIRKGVPSLFASLKHFYTNTSLKSDQTPKYLILGKIAENFSQSLKETKKFPNSSLVEDNEAYIWAEYFYTQHLDRCGNSEEALDRLEKIIEMNTSIVELGLFKAKLTKHLGDFAGAQDLMNTTRNIELNDRFLNTKTVKYMLRNDEIKSAEETILLFVRKDATNRLQELVDMQVNWYMLERGKAHFRKRKYGRALVCFGNVIQAFEDFYDDQLDFHSYCLRKSTIHAYIDMTQWEDNLYSSSQIYQEAVCEYIQSLLALHDRAKNKQQAIENPHVEKPSSKSKPSNLQQTSQTTTQPQITGEDEASNSMKFVNSTNPLDFSSSILNTLNKFKVHTLKLDMARFEVYIRKPGSLSSALDALIDGCEKGVKPIIVVNYIRLLKAIEDESVNNPEIKSSIKVNDLVEIIKNYYGTKIDFNLSECEILDQLSKIEDSNGVSNSLDAAYGFECLFYTGKKPSYDNLLSACDILLRIFNKTSEGEFNDRIPYGKPSIKIILRGKEIFSRLVSILSSSKKNTKTGDVDNELAITLQSKYESFLEHAKMLYPRSTCF